MAGHSGRRLSSTDGALIVLGFLGMEETYLSIWADVPSTLHMHNFVGRDILPARRPS